MMSVCERLTTTVHNTTKGTPIDDQYCSYMFHFSVNLSVRWFAYNRTKKMLESLSPVHMLWRNHLLALI